jgi:protein SCO1
MSRTTIRVLGVLVGILGGTIAALGMRGMMKSDKRVDKISMPADMPGHANSDPTNEPDENATTPEVADPGRRNELISMVANAKLEPAWLKEFELTERSGRTIRSEDLKGQPYVACFFFTTCPGSCKRQSDQMRLLQSKFIGKPIRFVSITVDPEVDTPDVLTKYAEQYSADKERWLFLTGPMESISKIGVEKFFLFEVKPKGHPDRFCLVNAEGDVVGEYAWPDKEERALLIEHANELLGQTK